jgi:outer membrane lipoprotein SlyB
LQLFPIDKETLLNKHIPIAAALWAAACLAPAWAAESAKAAALPKVVQGVKLAGICGHCGVVTQVKSERRKGEASGVGAVGGAVAGGVVGKSTTDSTVGTVGGAAVGGLLGHEIEKRAKSHRVWTTTVTMKDGSVRKFETLSNTAWKTGSVVEVGTDNKLKKR